MYVSVLAHVKRCKSKLPSNIFIYLSFSSAVVSDGMSWLLYGT